MVVALFQGDSPYLCRREPKKPWKASSYCNLPSDLDLNPVVME